MSLEEKVPGVAALARLVGLPALVAVVGTLLGAGGLWAEDQRSAMGDGRALVRYWPENVDKARLALEAADTAVTSLEGELNMHLERRINIDVARSHHEFQELTGTKHGEWVLGQAFYDRSWIVVKAVGDLNLRQLVAHEICHIMLGQKLQATGVEAPRWLHEGLAKYTAQQWTSDDTQIIGRAAVEGGLIPLAKLDDAFAGKVEQVSLAYAESYTLVQFLVEREGPKGLGNMVEELARTGDINRALVRTYNLPVEKLERLWLESVQRLYAKQGLPVVDELAIFVAMGVLFLIAVVVQRRKARIIRIPAWPFFWAAAVCEAVCKPFGWSPPIYRRRVAFFTKDRSFDTSKLRERLGYTYGRTTEQGLRDTARWYRDNGWM